MAVQANFKLTLLS